jgi:hypothetical protein
MSELPSFAPVRESGGIPMAKTLGSRTRGADASMASRGSRRLTPRKRCVTIVHS